MLSIDGEEFLGYARQVIEQTELIEEKYAGKHLFCVSAQHYSFVVEAFVDLLQNYGGEEYDFRIRETQTYEIIEDVAKPHVFVSSANPLAGRKEILIEDLAPYPRLSYEQGEHNSFYFSEEILSTRESKMDIVVRDRATLFNLLIGLNGYTICSGMISEALNGENIVAVPLAADDYMEIGYVLHNKVVPSRLTEHYIEALRQHVSENGGLP